MHKLYNEIILLRIQFTLIGKARQKLFCSILIQFSSKFNENVINFVLILLIFLSCCAERQTHTQSNADKNITAWRM
jgi:hypothetical protein